MEKRVLVARWLRNFETPIPIYDEASVSSARHRVRDAGLLAGASKDLIERVALISTELTHNQLAHAKQGYFGVKAIERQGVKGLEVIAADLGPGIGKAILAGAGGIRSEGGSLGAGLEGIFRLADEIELDTRGAEGVCVVARKFESKAAPLCEIAIAGTPYPGEVISGDDCVCVWSDSGFVAAVCDGLGHGPEAREASNRAIDVLLANSQIDLTEVLAIANTSLAGTRGSVMGIVRFTNENHLVQCVLAGDVRAQMYHLKDTHFFTPTPFIVGDADMSKRRIRVEETSAPAGAVFTMFTDGLETKTSLKAQLDVLRRPAISIAQHLIETHSRGTDDALVFVARLT